MSYVCCKLLLLLLINGVLVSSSDLKIHSLVLMETNFGEDLQVIQDGDVVDLTTSGKNLTIRAEITTTDDHHIGPIRFNVDGKFYNIDDEPPYVAAGNNNNAADDDAYPSIPALAFVGQHTISASTIDGEDREITIHMVDGDVNNSQVDGYISKSRKKQRRFLRRTLDISILSLRNSETGEIIWPSIVDGDIIEVDPLVLPTLTIQVEGVEDLKGKSVRFDFAGTSNVDSSNPYQLRGGAAITELATLGDFVVIATMARRKRFRAKTGTPYTVSFTIISSLDPYPTPPYIEVENSSQVAVIPDPEIPNMSTDQTECPQSSSNLLDWHESATWVTPPQEGEDVTLPANTRVIVKKTISEKLGVIHIPPDSALIVDENEDGITIDSTGFDVQGNLTVGSESCRRLTPLVITLHGERPSDPVSNTPPPTNKGISVQGGTLSLHGKRYFHTWTRLAKTVLPGDKIIMLQHSVNWEVGQDVVLVTSAIKDSRDYNLNEVRTIENLHPNPPPGVGAVVYLTEPVQFSHTANEYYQVEVGLLSRTIKIQGAADSEPSDPDPLDGSCLFVDSTAWYHRDTTMPCMDKELTGYGGHVMVHSGGMGQVEGIELYRMGQTNVLGRYPFHFHLLGDCPSCYIRDSSVRRSFYRCVSLHGTNNSLVTENVAYDVTGYCYYLEDGVEQENIISFNLAAHIHTIGPDMSPGSGQKTSIYYQGPSLTLPADVTASGFYITNAYNYIEGNAASGGWAGFALPSLPTGLRTFQSLAFRPANAPGLVFNGNTGHSSGWWWSHASPFYVGGALYHGDNGLLVYNPGRSTIFNRDVRRPCNVNTCIEPYNNCAWCPGTESLWLRMTNTKSFLTAGVGMNSWFGRMEVINYESHDARLGIEALSNGFWINNMLVVCRTRSDLGLPEPRANGLEGSGFYWYDTAMSHIITDATFRNCGYRSDEYNDYDQSPSRGCINSDRDNGCAARSTVFGFLTHSDQHNPEVMQATANITFDNCGRRFRFTYADVETVSGRSQNWPDVDGSVSGLMEDIIIASGLEGSKHWWNVEDEVVYEPQAPLRFIKKNNGPDRTLAHIRLDFDPSLHDQVGSTLCGNYNSAPCDAVAYIRHLGPLFSPTNVSRGLPVTANPDIAGLAGGYGWLLSFLEGVPRSLKITEQVVDPSTTLMLSIPYPIGTTFTITASSEFCSTTASYSCELPLMAVGSVDAVRIGSGDTYHVDADGILTLRIIQNSNRFIGIPEWFLPDYDTVGRYAAEVYALPRFERSGILLPQKSSSILTIQARCPSDDDGSPADGYCTESAKADYDPEVCDTGYVQVAYDKCCHFSDKGSCKFANGMVG